MVEPSKRHHSSLIKGSKTFIQLTQKMDPEMGSYQEDNQTYKARELYVLSDKIEELHRTKEELKQAKDEAMQSWLDSRPIIDELERLQFELANAKEESENNTLVAKLESELMAINMKIRVKKEEELRSRTEINEMTQVSESVRAEMERIKLEINEGRRERSKMKMVIKMKRQSLRTLNLTLRAVRLEVEAYSAAVESASEQIGRGKVSGDTATDTANDTIELTQEEYFALMRRAKEETSLSDWRVLVATEQKLAAEESRDLASKRLNDPMLKVGSMKKKKDTVIYEKGGLSSSVRAQTPFPRGRTKLVAYEETTRGPSRSEVSKKKRSVFVQIKSFLARKIKYLFG